MRISTGWLLWVRRVSFIRGFMSLSFISCYIISKMGIIILQMAYYFRDGFHNY